MVIISCSTTNNGGVTPPAPTNRYSSNSNDIRSKENGVLPVSYGVLPVSYGDAQGQDSLTVREYSLGLSKLPDENGNRVGGVGDAHSNINGEIASSSKLEHWGHHHPKYHKLKHHNQQNSDSGDGGGSLRDHTSLGQRVPESRLTGGLSHRGYGPYHQELEVEHYVNNVQSSPNHIPVSPLDSRGREGKDVQSAVEPWASVHRPANSLPLSSSGASSHSAPQFPSYQHASDASLSDPPSSLDYHLDEFPRVVSGNDQSGPDQRSMFARERKAISSSHLYLLETNDVALQKFGVNDVLEVPESSEEVEVDSQDHPRYHTSSSSGHQSVKLHPKNRSNVPHHLTHHGKKQHKIPANVLVSDESGPAEFTVETSLGGQINTRLLHKKDNYPSRENYHYDLSSPSNGAHKKKNRLAQDNRHELSSLSEDDESQTEGTMINIPKKHHHRRSDGEPSKRHRRRPQPLHDHYNVNQKDLEKDNRLHNNHKGHSLSQHRGHHKHKNDYGLQTHSSHKGNYNEKNNHGLHSGSSLKSSSPTSKEWKEPSIDHPTKDRHNHRMSTSLDGRQDSTPLAVSEGNPESLGPSVAESRNRRYLSASGNHHLPKFEELKYGASVKEDTPVGSSILTVYATDDDTDHTGIIQYVTDNDQFSVDTGGVVIVNKRLDYEGTGGNYFFNVYARNPDTPPTQWARVPVTVRVQDTREAPEFDSQRYSFKISEFALLGEYVGRVVAWDPEATPVRYSLEGVNPVKLFNVDTSTGVITVGDRTAATDWTYNFRAAATDTENVKATVPVTVEIIGAIRTFPVIDENTHKPKFLECQTYQKFHLLENQTAPVNVIIVKATDQDHGVHGKVTYSFVGDVEAFDINSVSGQIFTTAPLDRDGGTKEYFLTVVARDGGEPPLEGSCTFEVLLDDINDNPPIFDQPTYTQDIPVDSELQGNLLRVTASDADSGLNALLSYSITGDEGYFEVAPTTGYIKLKKTLEQNFANVKTFTLTAKATDTGSPALSATATVRINVVGSDQMAPSVVERDPAPEVREDAAANQRVAQLCATSNTDNVNDVYFTLFAGNTPSMNGEGTFDIMKVPGANCPPNTVGAEIYVSVANLDYEEIKTYKLIVQVSNSNARIDHAVTVRVVDVNDEVPLLQPPLSGFISENNEPGALIMSVRAIDKDETPAYRQLTYSIKSDSPPEVLSNFRVDPTTGDLFATKSLDREVKKNYGINIMVTDGLEGHSRSSRYWITIYDVNDEPPKFNRNLGNYSVIIPEDLEKGKNTGILLHVDDLDDVNEFNYQIIAGNEADKFSIDPKTGEVTVNKKLDYDSPTNDRAFRMDVTVSDGRNYDTTAIVINVTNVNDQRPVFEPSYYNITVTENTECDKQKVQVRAYDPDLPASEEQNIRYYLSREQTKNFSLNSITGWFSVKGCLDREASSGGVELINPRADDGGGHGINAEPGTIEITILDLNDNHPYIKSPDHSRARVRENLPPSAVPVIPIQLDDADTPEHGCPCNLSFDPNTDPVLMDLFEVEKVPGEPNNYRLRVLQELDREKQKLYLVPFQTSDSEGVSGIRYLTIEVDDVNDSPMTNGQSSITVYNYEGSFPNIVIGSVYVTDADDHDVDDKTFEIDAATSHIVENRFLVDKNSGNITMLAGTGAGEYKLVVKVTDHVRRETALGTMIITVIELPEAAVRQSGSFLVGGHTALSIIERSQGGLSVYDRLKVELGLLYGVKSANVDIFTLTNQDGGVVVRFNCHGSPYFSEPRLNGLLLQRKAEIESKMNIKIPLVDTNKCLYEEISPCYNSSCTMSLRINGTFPDIIRNGDATVVGIQADEYYACTCYEYQSAQRESSQCHCLNGGQCLDPSDSSVCTCPDNLNYGPKCELLTARLQQGYAWFVPLDTCEDSTISISFESDQPDGILFYSGPIVAKPYEEYPKDFVYMILDGDVVQAYLELGTGTMDISVTLAVERNTLEPISASLSWNSNMATLEVVNCGGFKNQSTSRANICKVSTNLPGEVSPSFLFNAGGPLQLGGMAQMPSFSTLAQSYGWTSVPKQPPYFSGCISKLQFNEKIYDMNSTDYHKNFHRTCSDVRTGAVVQLGTESIIIMIISLLLLLLLLILLVLLSRRSKRQPSYPDNLQFVSQTMGPSNVEGCEEKDATRFDLNMLRVTPDGQLLSTEKVPRPLPDVTAYELPRRAPLAALPDGLAIGDYLTDSLHRINSDPGALDNVRHYCYEGDDISIASLSSLASGSTDDRPDSFSDLNEWGPKFERLNSLYGQQDNAADSQDSSEVEFPTLPKDAARSYRRARFAPERRGGDEGTPMHGEGGGGQPYHETINPLAKVYGEEGTGLESWC